MNDSINIVQDTSKILMESLMAIQDSTEAVKDIIIDSSSANNTDYFELIRSVILILIGALISTVFLSIQNHSRLFKISEFIDVVFKSLYKRINAYEKGYSELITKLQDPTNMDFIPPVAPEVESDMIDALKKEDLFEIFLVRKRIKNIPDAKERFLKLMNSIKFFDTVFSSTVEEAKRTVQQIDKHVNQISENQLHLMATLGQIRFDVKEDDEFSNKILDIYGGFLDNNNGHEINNFDLYEKELIFR